MHPKINARGVRWLLGGALMAAAAGVGLTTSGTATAQTAAVTTPRCTTSSLEVWIGLGTGGAGTGSTVYPLEFSNVTSHACHLYGFPGVSAQKGGHQVGSAAKRDTTTPAQTVTLGAGATAHARLTITDVSAFPPTSCKPVTAEGLAVYPPGAFTAADVPFAFRACSASGPSFLSVRVVQPRVGIPGH
jgi:uncharacterized protein DUF4232